MEEFDVSQVFESVALSFLALATSDNDEKLFEAVLLGEHLHLKVRNSMGEILFKVVGKDYNELGEQLVLACLHKVSAAHLATLHLRPLQGVPPVLRRV